MPNKTRDQFRGRPPSGQQATGDAGCPAPSREHLQLILDTAPDAIITIDAAGVILSFSVAARRMFGYEEDEAVGSNISCLMPEPHASQHHAYIGRYLNTGERRVIGIGRQVQARRKDGTIFPIELAVGELLADGRPVFTGFIRDISDRVAAQRRARRLQLRLDQVSRMQMLGEMSTALAHEINQPLSAIANYASAAGRVLGGSEPDLARARTSLEHIAEQAQRAGEIIRRMRRLVDRGQVSLEVVDVNEIVREAVAFSRHAVADEAIAVELHLAEGLPLVKADRIQIQQVVVNLLRNAEEAIVGPDAPEVEISTGLDQAAMIEVTAARHGNGDVRVTIADTGGGVAPEVRERLFEPFTSTKETGLGVGLAVCHSIIRAHGGRIWAENTPHGASFHFTLPPATA